MLKKLDSVLCNFVLPPSTMKHSSLSIVTDEDLHGRNILHLNLFTLLRDCSTIPSPTHHFALLQSFAEFGMLLNNTWTERFGRNTTRKYDLQVALFGYDAMWLGALALDLAETKLLQNMTHNLTLGDFQYTGKNSAIIKDAIYSSALEVNFSGASVSDMLTI